MRTISLRAFAAFAATVGVLSFGGTGRAAPSDADGTRPAKRPPSSKGVAPLLRVKLRNGSDVPIGKAKYKRCFDHLGGGGCSPHDLCPPELPAKPPPPPPPPPPVEPPLPETQHEPHEDSLSVKLELSITVTGVEYTGWSDLWTGAFPGPVDYQWLKYVDVTVDSFEREDNRYLAKVTVARTVYKPQYPSEEIELPALAAQFYLDPVPPPPYEDPPGPPCPAPCAPCPKPCAPPCPPAPPPAPKPGK